ncbi:MAG: hypothetical protein KA105_08765 [Caulobacter sp.]|nr:hypothetical protein [Caulobacter sp.]
MNRQDRKTLIGLAGAVTLTLASVTAQARQPGPPPGAEPGLFISPTGKPFRPSVEGPAPLDAWWREADANGDGVLSRDELVADALSFFDTLDVDRDGILDGLEVTRYEREVAPEILRVGPAGGRAGPQRRMAGRGEESGGPPGGGPGGGGGGPPRRGADGSKPKGSGGGPAPIGREGAARFGLLNDPQPVMSADYDLNRRIGRDEYARKAKELFAELDRDKDGRVARQELPRIQAGPGGPPPKRR